MVAPHELDLGRPHSLRGDGTRQPSTWEGRHAPTSAVMDRMIRTFLNQARPQLSQAQVDHFTESDDRLTALTAFIVRPIDHKMHAGGGTLGHWRPRLSVCR